MPFTELKVRQVDDKHWELLADLEYFDKNRKAFVAQKGFLTNFTSVPRIYSWLVPRVGRPTKASVIHDAMWSDDQFDPCRANEVFLESLEELGVPHVQRLLMWSAVRWGKGRFCSWPQVGKFLLVSIATLPVVLVGGVLVGSLVVAFELIEWMWAAFDEMIESFRH